MDYVPEMMKNPKIIATSPGTNSTFTLYLDETNVIRISLPGRKMFCMVIPFSN